MCVLVFIFWVVFTMGLLVAVPAELFGVDHRPPLLAHQAQLFSSRSEGMEFRLSAAC